MELQREVWGFDNADVVSERMLDLCRGYGGILLGACAGNGLMTGFVFSFPTPLGKKVIQHSHMLAVSRLHRDQGVGRLLKMAQYEKAMSLGNSLITWTFDPLEARNGYLNLVKLGARVRRYYENLYGETTSSPLHAGLGTDRFLVEWPVRAEGPRTQLGKVGSGEGMKIPQLIRTVVDEQKLLRPLKVDLERTDSTLAAEIPCRIQQLKAADSGLARDWRETTRMVFTHYLSLGYEVCGMMVESSDELNLKTFYLLKHRPAA